MPVPTQSHQVHALSTSQERKLIDYVEDSFLELTRNYKKRSDPSSTLRSLPSYLKAAHTLLSLILQIPPIDPSTSLRTTFLLRLTGEIMNSVIGYPPDEDVLPELLEWLNELDRGWLAVLRAQGWDCDTQSGRDIILASSDTPIISSPLNQTERARLRSLLISGTGNLEEWLLNLTGGGGEDYEAALERLGLQQGFDELFNGTLAEMGSLAGSNINESGDAEETC